MQRQSTISRPTDTLARRLTAAEVAYGRDPSPRHRTGVTVWFHRWYWAREKRPGPNGPPTTEAVR
jgi:hypothetical protein